MLDFYGCLLGIWSLQNGATHHDETRTQSGSFRRCHDAFLVSCVGTFGPNSRCDEKGGASEVFSQYRNFVWGANQAIRSGINGKFAEFLHLFRNGGGDPDLDQKLWIKRGQDGDGDELCLGGRFIPGLLGSRNHFRASRGVKGQHLNRATGQAFDGTGHRVGNVVQLQVQKDAVIFFGDFFQELWSVAGKHLEADFYPGQGVVELVQEVESLSFLFQIESKNELAGLGFHFLKKQQCV